MSVQIKDEKQIIEIVHSAVEHFGSKKEELIPILSKVNNEIGHLPNEALVEISNKLGLPKSKVNGVASFYHMLSTKPRGRHVIKFCESAPCHVAGGREVWSALQELLQISSGQTSPDGKWTLETTSCLGVCAVGPVMIIDDDIYGNITPVSIPDILAKYE